MLPARIIFSGGCAGRRTVIDGGLGFRHLGLGGHFLCRLHGNFFVSKGRGMTATQKEYLRIARAAGREAAASQRAIAAAHRKIKRGK